MVDRDELRPLIRELIEHELRRDGAGSGSPITQSDVLAARHHGQLPAGATLTPEARDAAERFGVRQGGASPLPAREKPRSPSPLQIGGAIAIGSDHGGFALKEQLRSWLDERGRLRVVDFGSHDGSSCDYPDIALAVARSVAMGDAEFGLLIDGAGIGSCMAANKVPGVLAANCHSPATARNSREHNSANVLCLGSGHLDIEAATEILMAWLDTPFGGGRHGRRVAKILSIEATFCNGEPTG